MSSHPAPDRPAQENAVRSNLVASIRQATGGNNRYPVGVSELTMSNATSARSSEAVHASQLARSASHTGRFSNNQRPVSALPRPSPSINHPGGPSSAPRPLPQLATGNTPVQVSSRDPPPVGNTSTPNARISDPSSQLQPRNGQTEEDERSQDPVNNVLLRRVVELTEEINRQAGVMVGMARDITLIRSALDRSQKNRSQKKRRTCAKSIEEREIPLPDITDVDCTTFFNDKELLVRYALTQMCDITAYCFLSQIDNGRTYFSTPSSFDSLRNHYAPPVKAVPDNTKDRVPENWTSDVLVSGLSVLLFSVGRNETKVKFESLIGRMFTFMMAKSVLACFLSEGERNFRKEDDNRPLTNETRHLVAAPEWYKVTAKNNGFALMHTVETIMSYQKTYQLFLGQDLWPAEWGSSDLDDEEFKAFLHRECLVGACNSSLREQLKLGRKDAKTCLLESFGFILFTIEKNGWTATEAYGHGFGINFRETSEKEEIEFPLLIDGVPFPFHKGESISAHTSVSERNARFKRVNELFKQLKSLESFQVDLSWRCEVVKPTQEESVERYEAELANLNSRLPQSLSRLYINDYDSIKLHELALLMLTLLTGSKNSSDSHVLLASENSLLAIQILALGLRGLIRRVLGEQTLITSAEKIASSALSYSSAESSTWTETSALLSKEEMGGDRSERRTTSQSRRRPSSQSGLSHSSSGPLPREKCCEKKLFIDYDSYTSVMDERARQLEEASTNQQLDATSRRSQTADASAEAAEERAVMDSLPPLDDAAIIGGSFSAF